MCTIRARVCVCAGWAMRIHYMQRPELVRGCKTVILTPNVIEFSRLRDALGVPQPPPAKVSGSSSSSSNVGDEQTRSSDNKEDEQEVVLKAVCRKLDGVTILQKGAVDLISDGDHLLRCDVEGGPRRSGGLGDILAGTLGIVSAWASMAAARTAAASDDDASTGVVEPGAAGAGAASVVVWAGKEQLWAALAACSITRSSCGAAFAKEKRATTVHASPLPPPPPVPRHTSLSQVSESVHGAVGPVQAVHVLSELGEVFEHHCPALPSASL